MHGARILFVEDSRADYDNLVAYLRASEAMFEARRVDDAAQMRGALASGRWDLVISDYHMPCFSAAAALAILRESAPDTPFMIVSGAIGEELAAQAMRDGACDYVMKSNLARLAPAVARSLKEAGVHRDKREAQERLRESEARALRELSAHLERAKEAERAYVARELHDDLGGLLTGLKAQLSVLAGRHARVKPLREGLERCLELVGAAFEFRERLVARLRPSALDAGLVEAARWQAREFHKHFGVKCSVNCATANIELDAEQSTAAFRVLQEALTNAGKHARASTVRVRLRLDGEHFSMQISDDGVGIAPQRNAGRRSFGMHGMSERVRSLGGTLEVSSAPRAGTTISVTLPRRPPQDAAASRA